MTIHQLEMAIGYRAVIKLQLLRGRIEDAGGPFRFEARGYATPEPAGITVKVTRQRRSVFGGYLLQLSCGHSLRIVADDSLNSEGLETTCSRSHR
jgi:hypothetical protein